MAATNNVRLNERDLAILRELGDVGLLDTPEIHRRHFPADRTGRACQRRLALLADHGLIVRVALPMLFADQRGGRIPTIFRLTPEGVEYLREAVGVEPARPILRDPKPDTILHRLGLAKLRLVVNDACELEGFAQPRWIDEYATRSNVPLKAPHHERFWLCHRFPTDNGATVTAWPDAVSFLEIPLPDGTPHSLIRIWEYDRSIESLKQLTDKLHGLAEFVRTEAWRSYWPDITMPTTTRIAFVFPSESRLHFVQHGFQSHPHADIVRLTTTSDLRAEAVLQEPIWQDQFCEGRAILAARP